MKNWVSKMVVLALVFGTQTALGQAPASGPTTAPAGTPPPAAEAKRNLDLSTDMWCKDSATFCWGKGSFVPGLRIIGEPNFGYLLQSGGDRFEPTTLIGTAKIGVALSLVQAWIALELSVIPPFTSNLTTDSRSVTEDRIKEGGTAVDVDYGVAAGIAAFDGILSVGGGGLFYNPNQFRGTVNANDGFVYIALNPISAVRSATKD